jgi:hypothetical protein
VLADILVGRGVRRPAPTIFDLISGPATAAQSALGAMGSAAKGAAQATVGLPGDIESLVRMLTGGEQALPTTEQVGQFVNQYIRAPYPQYERLGEFTGLPTAGVLSRPATQLTNEAADALVRAITRNPQATAPRVIQETAMPFMQAVAPRTPGLLETPVKSDLGFYSALEQATTPLQNKGTGQQFLAQIEKTAGVKPEEIKWTGLDDFLKSKPTVTKQEVQDYLAANRVDLQEVRLGEPSPEDVRLFMEDEAGRGYDYEDALDYLRGTGDAPKFSSYTIPGGENYREILLTLPAKNPEFDPADLSRLTELSNKTRTADETAEYRALASRYDASLRGETTPEYRSSHFDQPNILAHMRVNDRIVDGKKTMFIEEIQSDWHQAGRKKGYDTPEARAAEQQKLDNIFAERQQLLDEQRRLEELALPYTSQGKDAPSEIVDQWSIVSNRINNLQTEQNRLGRGFGQQVPDAPFKTSWHELALKRAIQEASEKGYDKIAFTTGKTQAERYDLSKQVNKIDVEAVDEVPNLYFVDVDVAGRGKMNLEVENGVVRQGEFEGKPLEDVVGKEIAEKVFAVQQGQTTRLQGDDLRIGGEGMKGFYDNILPKSLEKLGKKFDAKVTKSKLQSEAKGRSFAEELENSEFRDEWLTATKERRNQIIDTITARQKQNEIEVWSMDITPKMRESVVTKGQPLFAATPAVGLLGDENE